MRVIPDDRKEGMERTEQRPLYILKRNEKRELEILSEEC